MLVLKYLTFHLSFWIKHLLLLVFYSYRISHFSLSTYSFLLCLSFSLSYQYVSLSIQCDFTHLALGWHSLPLLSGSSPFPHLQVKSILTHRPQGPNWTVTEFLQPRWAPTTKLRINGWGARARQKNQCLFIQTWQSRRPSNSPACSSRRCVILFFFFFPFPFSLSCVVLSPLLRIKCVPSWEDRTVGDALWPFCPQFVLTMHWSIALGSAEWLW